MRSRARLTGMLCVTFATGWIVAPLPAQYNPPGSSVEPQQMEVQDEEALRSSVEDAGWRLGILRLQPWISVRDARFVTSSEDDETDFTVNVGAGLRGYFKTGPKIVWAAHVLPEYVWWQDEADRRRLNGRFGFGFFGYFNRLQLEVSARRNETQGFFTSEVQELSTSRRDIARLGFELRLADRFFLYGAHVRAKTESQEEEPTLFSSLDRTREEARIGLRIRSPRGFWLGAGYEEIDEEFDDPARDLSNTGDALLFDAGYEGGRFRSALHLERLSLESSGGSQFVSRKLTTGFLETTWELRRGVELFLYGRRELGFSVQAGNSSTVNERFGTRLGLDLRGTYLDFSAELGQDEFDTSSGVSERIDDVVAFGMNLSFGLARYLTLSLGVIHTEYDSNFSVFDRDVTAYGATVRVLPLSDKLKLGENQKVW